jgi:uncharacterized protein (TIGR02271 family)
LTLFRLESFMNQTVVGVFNSYDAAQRAADALSREGFDSSEVQIKGTGSAGASSTSSSTSGASDGTGEGTGVMASIRHFFADLFGDDGDHAGHYTEAVRRGGAVVTVEVDEVRLERARDVLDSAGAVDIEEQVSRWRSEGWTGYDEDAPQAGRQETLASRAGRETTGEAENVLPVIQEELEVGKRQVSGGAVRIVSRVVSRPVSESVDLRREEAVVERRPVDRPASQADLTGLQERTVEVTEMAEKAVVNKTARVVEEVVVGKHVTHDTQTVEDTVRSTEVQVERVGDDESRTGSTGSRGSSGMSTPGGMGSSGSLGGATVTGATASGGRRSFSDDEDEFRRDFETQYASSGGRYEDYQPAYRGGYEWRSDSQYSNRDWDDVEPQLRQRWERDYPGSAWERFKAAVRRGWERATS